MEGSLTLRLPLWSETGAKKYFGFLLILEQTPLPWAGCRPSLISVGTRGKYSAGKETHRPTSPPLQPCWHGAGAGMYFVIKQRCWGLGGWQGWGGAAREQHRHSVVPAASDAQPGSQDARKQTGKEFEIDISSRTPAREAVFIHCSCLFVFPF